MKRLLDYLKSLEDRKAARKAARMAHWRRISPLRRNACYAMLFLAFLIIGAGILIKTFHTAVFIAMMLMLVLPFVIRGPQWGRRLAVAPAILLLTMLPLGLALGGLTMDIDYENALSQREMLSAHQDDVARDARQFLANYEAGKVRELEHLQPNGLVSHVSTNDRLAYHASRHVFDLIHLSAPAEIDTKAILPLPEMLYADHVVFLYDEEIVARHAALRNADLQNLPGAPAANTPVDFASVVPMDYPGIFGLTCAVKDTGEVLQITGMPAAYWTDLRSHPGSEPFVELCRSVARDKAGASP